MQKRVLFGSIFWKEAGFQYSRNLREYFIRVFNPKDLFSSTLKKLSPLKIASMLNRAYGAVPLFRVAISIGIVSLLKYPDAEIVPSSNLIMSSMDCRSKSISTSVIWIPKPADAAESDDL